MVFLLFFILFFLIFNKHEKMVVDEQILISQLYTR